VEERVSFQEGTKKKNTSKFSSKLAIDRRERESKRQSLCIRIEILDNYTTEEQRVYNLHLSTGTHRIQTIFHHS
jgi:hypothetical protein